MRQMSCGRPAWIRSLMDRFSFRDYLSSPEKRRETAQQGGGYDSFSALCADIKADILGRWSSPDGESGAADIQKRAIIGYEKEKAYFMELILEAAGRLGALGTAHPPWYPDLAEAVYQENWGFAGLSEWFGSEYAQSSSERMDRSYYELYLLDGTRVTVYTEPLAKGGQPCMVLRRYIIPRLTLSEQAKRGTIPEAAIPLFEVMVRIGFNVVFLGAVRTANWRILRWKA